MRERERERERERGGEREREREREREGWVDLVGLNAKGFSNAETVCKHM